MASNNMYRVGDFVYFETSAAAPYQIRKIDELNKTATGAVEAKVICFYRRRDIASSLVQLADKHHKNLFGDEDEDAADMAIKIASEQRHRVKHRELFLSRQVETLPATHIRGKCQVTLLSDTDSTVKYIEREDDFFYQLVYDAVQRTLLADKGEMRVGTKFQAVIPPRLESPEEDDRDSNKLESLVWSPEHPLNEAKLDEFLLLARSVGTLARAYDHTSSIRQPNLLMSAAAASRDITKQRAFDLLFTTDFDLTKAVAQMVPKGAPWLCRDEMEEWSASEGNLFEEAVEKYGKFFHDIHNDFLPWKTPKGIVEYYYMWKTTDHYVQQKRIKAAEAEHKLKQVYIPNYNKPNPAVLYTSKTTGGCESCQAQSSPQWYSWGPSNVQCKLCQSCWTYWKRYGGLKNPSKIGNGSANGSSQLPSGSDGVGQQVQQSRGNWQMLRQGGSSMPSQGTVTSGSTGSWGSAGGPPSTSRNRVGFYMVAKPAVRVGRRLCDTLIQLKRLAKQPFSRTVSSVDFQKELQQHLSKLDAVSANSRISLGRVPTTMTATLKQFTALEKVSSTIPPILNRDKLVVSADIDKQAFPRDLELLDKLNKTIFVDRSGNLEGETEASSPDMVKEGKEDASIVDTPTASARKRALENSEDTKDEPLRKRQQIMPTQNFQSKKPGMTKDSGMGTHLYIASEPLKKHRWVIGATKIRKLGRSPWKSVDSCFSGNSGEETNS